MRKPDMSEVKVPMENGNLNPQANGSPPQAATGTCSSIADRTGCILCETSQISSHRIASHRNPLRIIICEPIQLISRFRGDDRAFTQCSWAQTMIQLSSRPGRHLLYPSFSQPPMQTRVAVCVQRRFRSGLKSPVRLDTYMRAML
jgi:hypothetical protein